MRHQDSDDTKTRLSNVLVERVHRLVQLSASLLDRLVDGLVCFLPVCLGILADLCAFAGDILLANVLDLGCVGCE
jgi:hypothetical protein